MKCIPVLATISLVPALLSHAIEPSLGPTQNVYKLLELSSIRYDATKPNPSRGQRIREFDELSGTLSADETRQVFREISEMMVKHDELVPFGLTYHLSLYVRLGETDPDNALTFKPIPQYFKCGDSPPEWMYIITGIARVNGPKAFDLWKTRISAPKKPQNPVHEDDLGTDNSFSDLLMKGWAAGNPEQAFQALDQPELAKVLSTALLGYYKGLKKGTNWKVEAQRLAGLKGMEHWQRAAPARTLAQRWFQEQATEALDWCRTSPLFSGSPGGEPPSTEALEENLLPGVIYVWMSEDPKRSLEWLQKWQPADLNRDKVIQNAYQRVGSDIIPVAQILPLIKDPAIRKEINEAHNPATTDPFATPDPEPTD